MEEGENDDMTTVLEYTKSWLFPGTGSVGTRLNLHTGYDLLSCQCTARLGFRTENTTGATLPLLHLRPPYYIIIMMAIAVVVVGSPSYR